MTLHRQQNFHDQNLNSATHICSKFCWERNARIRIGYSDVLRQNRHIHMPKKYVAPANTAQWVLHMSKQMQSSIFHHACIFYPFPSLNSQIHIRQRPRNILLARIRKCETTHVSPRNSPLELLQHQKNTSTLRNTSHNKFTPTTSQQMKQKPTQKQLTHHHNPALPNTSCQHLPDNTTHQVTYMR